MNPDNEKDPNNPTRDRDDKLTEGSYQAIEGGEQGVEDSAADSEASTDKKSENKDTFKTITDLQDERGKDSGVDAARREGPYGVQE